MAKFLLDENVPFAIGVFLRSMNFDVNRVKESGLLGASDDQILCLAIQEERTLITFDKHFADLVLYPPARIGESPESVSIRRCLPTSHRPSIIF